MHQGLVTEILRFDEEVAPVKLELKGLASAGRRRTFAHELYI